jgi:hypothetical protein
MIRDDDLPAATQALKMLFTPPARLSHAAPVLLQMMFSFSLLLA